MQIKVGEESKMAKDQRFEKVYSQGMLETTEIWVDKKTGVNYIFHTSGKRRETGSFLCMG